MQVQNWIRRIGIVSTIIAGYGVLEMVLKYGIIKGGSNTQTASEIPFFFYTLSAVRLFLLFASVLYLLKKNGAVRLLLLALLLKIIHAFALRLLDLQTGSVSGMDLPSFTGIVFNLILFMGVYRFRSDFYKTPEELVALYGKPPADGGMRPSVLKAISLAGVCFLMVPLSLQLLWIQAYSAGASHSERAAHYKALFPAFLSGYGTLSYISIAFALLSIIFSLIGMKYHKSIWKTINLLALAISIPLFLLTLFGLM